jgi:hypothetical protein
MQQVQTGDDLFVPEGIERIEIEDDGVSVQAAEQVNPLQEAAYSELAMRKLFDASSGKAAANQLPSGLGLA